MVFRKRWHQVILGEGIEVLCRCPDVCHMHLPLIVEARGVKDAAHGNTVLPIHFLAKSVVLLLGECASIPYREDEVVLAHHMVAVSDQMRKEVENLRFDRHEVVSPAQLAAAGVKRVILEKVQQGLTP